MSPPTAAPKATSLPTAWLCSACRAKKKNCVCIRKKWIFRRCSRCGRGDHLKSHRLNDFNSLNDWKPWTHKRLERSEAVEPFDILRAGYLNDLNIRYRPRPFPCALTPGWVIPSSMAVSDLSHRTTAARV